MKPRTLTICLLCLAIPASADINIFPKHHDRHEDRDKGRDDRNFNILASPDTRVDLSAVLNKDFIGSPSFDQAVEALNGDRPFFGLGWEVVMDHVGIGGQYLVNFHEDEPESWWLDWNGQAAYVSYHFLGARSFIDPFVDAGLGCAGRVFLGPEGENEAARLAITVYPFAGAGAALCFDGFKVGAKLDYALKRSGIPATRIEDYPLGRFQVSVLAGVSFGARPSR
jgi:hypothetical protein